MLNAEFSSILVDRKCSLISRLNPQTLQFNKLYFIIIDFIKNTIVYNVVYHSSLIQIKIFDIF